MRRADRNGAWPAWMREQAGRTADPALAGFYAAFNLTPSQAISDTPLVALDLETSGLDPRRSAILSIGILPFTLDRIRLADRRYWLLRPPAGVSGHSVAYHHITHAEIEQAPDFATVLPELLEALAGRLPVVHYHPIEREFLARAVRQRLGEDWRFPLIDTMVLESQQVRHGLKSRMRALLGRPPASIRLADSRARYGLPAYEGHQAVLDALATAELLQAQIQHHHSRSSGIGELWL